jgi:hypothetical protein
MQTFLLQREPAPPPPVLVPLLCPVPVLTEANALLLAVPALPRLLLHKTR